MTFTTTRREVQRDRWGRPMLLPSDGGKKRQPYTRVTTVAKTLEDTTNLTNWHKRMVAVGLANRPDLLAVVGATDPDEQKKQLDQICNDATEAASASRARNYGTALHGLCEAIDLGQRPTHIPDELKHDIAAYLRLRKRIGWSTEAVELFVANEVSQYAGTTDRVIMLDRRRYIADIKTGSISYGQLAIAAQLAMYADAVPYDIESDTWGDPLDVDDSLGFVIHVPHGEGMASLVPVDLTLGRKAAQLSLATRRLRKASFFGEAR